MPTKCVQSLGAAFCASFALLLNVFVVAPASAINITTPGDPIVATSNNSPGSEGVANAIDNQPTKYLNFDELNTGFTVTPSLGLSIVDGLSLTSANDAPERDPASFILSGSNDGLNFLEIASGPIDPFPTRFFEQTLSFDNDTPYLSYRLIFPTVANSAAANSMQISEVELLGVLVSQVPQPATLALLVLGLAGVKALQRRRTIHGLSRSRD